MELLTPVRVAVISAGYMAGEHLQAFSALPDVELVGIHSRSNTKAEQQQVFMEDSM